MQNISSFFNLGYRDESVQKYEGSLAKDNLKSVSAYSVMGIIVLLVSLLLRCLVHGIHAVEDLPLLAGSFMFAVLYAAARSELDYNQRRIKASRALIILFSVLCYLLGIYYDLLLRPQEVSVMICLTFFAIPCLFEFFPIHNLLLNVPAWFLILMVEYFVAAPDVFRKDIFFYAVSLFMGTFVGWHKASGKIAEQRYLEIYHAIGTIYERAFFLDLREDTCRTLQGSEEFRRIVRECSSPEEMVQEVSEKFVSEEFRQRYLDFMNFKTLNVRMRYARTLDFEYKNEKGLWYKIILIAQKRSEEDGRIDSLVIVGRNIHSQKLRELDYENLLNRTADDAIRENEIKTNYLRRISHDIRTTINGICGMVAIGEHYPDDSQKQEETRQKILLSARYLLDLMNGVLDINDLEAGVQRLQNEPETAPEENGKLSSDVSIQGVRILLVEDDAINMEIADFMLRDHGATVIKARDGLEAVEFFTHSKPNEYDVILMDLMMPRMNGLEASRLIRAMDRPDAVTVPIIAMTANAFLDDKESCLRAGMNYHVSKPVNTDHLIATIAECLHR